MPMQTIMKKKFSTDKAGDYRIVFSTFLLGNRVVCDIEIKKPYKNLYHAHQAVVQGLL